MPELEHPEKYDKVPIHKRKPKDPAIELSEEDKKIDWDTVYDEPGSIILDDLSGADDLDDDD